MDEFWEAKFLPAIQHPKTGDSQAWTEWPVREEWSQQAWLESRCQGFKRTSTAVTRRGEILRGKQHG